MSRLNLDERATLGDYAARASWPSGFSIYERGASADGVFVVVRGCVTLRCKARSGRSFVPCITTPGQTFGAEGLATAGTYVTDARAIDASDTLFVSGGQMRALLREQPTLAGALIAQIMAERSELLDRMREVTAMSVENRLLNGLQRMSQYPGFQSPSGHVELCSTRYRLLCELVGATRESVSVVMGKLISENLAERSGSTVFVPVNTRLAQRLGSETLASGIYSGFSPTGQDLASPS